MTLRPRSHSEQRPLPHLGTAAVLLAAITAVSVFGGGQQDSTVAKVAIGIGAVVLTLAVFGLVVVRPTIRAVAWSVATTSQAEDRADLLSQRIDELVAERERSARTARRLGGVLSAAQRELSREIALLGLTVEQAVANCDGYQSEILGRFRATLSRIEEDQRAVTALTRLGTTERVDQVSGFRAADIVPLVARAEIQVERNDLVRGDLDLWRLFVRNAVQNAELHGGAQKVTISTGDGRISIADDGSGCSTEDLERAWKSGLRPNGTRSDGAQIMRRIAEVHQAFVTLAAEPERGVRIVVDLRDLEIDLRERRAIAKAVGTPHKASGGRMDSAV